MERDADARRFTLIGVQDARQQLDRRRWRVAEMQLAALSFRERLRHLHSLFRALKNRLGFHHERFAGRRQQRAARTAVQ